MPSYINGGTTGQVVSDKHSSVFGRIKKGTQNVFGKIKKGCHSFINYRNSCKPGNKLKKRNSSKLMANESNQTAPSHEDQPSQVDSSPRRVSGGEGDLLTRSREEQQVSSRKPRPLTPMKGPQSQDHSLPHGTRGKPAERFTDHYPTRLSSVAEIDTPRSVGAERPFPPTPTKASRGHGGDDMDATTPAPMKVVRKPVRLSPVIEHKNAIGRNYGKDMGSKARDQQEESARPRSDYENGETTASRHIDTTGADTVEGDKLAGRDGSVDEVKDTETTVEQEASASRYDRRTIGRRDGSTGPVLEARQAYKEERAQEEQERRDGVEAGALEGKRPKSAKS